MGWQKPNEVQRRQMLSPVPGTGWAPCNSASWSLPSWTVALIKKNLWVYYLDLYPQCALAGVKACCTQGCERACRAGHTHTYWGKSGRGPQNCQGTAARGAERAGKISVWTGRLQGFNCCMQTYNWRVKAAQSHSPIGDHQGQGKKKQTSIATRENFHNIW